MSLKTTFVKTEEIALQLEFPQFSPMFFCEQLEEEERWKEADTT